MQGPVKAIEYNPVVNAIVHHHRPPKRLRTQRRQSFFLSCGRVCPVKPVKYAVCPSVIDVVESSGRRRQHAEQIIHGFTPSKAALPSRCGCTVEIENEGQGAML